MKTSINFNVWIDDEEIYKDLFKEVGKDFFGSKPCKKIADNITVESCRIESSIPVLKTKFEDMLNKLNTGDIKINIMCYVFPNTCLGYLAFVAGKWHFIHIN